MIEVKIVLFSGVLGQKTVILSISFCLLLLILIISPIFAERTRGNHSAIFRVVSIINLKHFNHYDSP